jgi:DNA-binding NtrC family response regulator
LRATKQTLELAGFSVSAFSVAGDALAALTPGFPGVIVSDIRMPQIDGLQLFDASGGRTKTCPSSWLPVTAIFRWR